MSEAAEARLREELRDAGEEIACLQATVGSREADVRNAQLELFRLKAELAKRDAELRRVTAEAEYLHGELARFWNGEDPDQSAEFELEQEEALQQSGGAASDCLCSEQQGSPEPLLLEEEGGFDSLVAFASGPLTPVAEEDPDVELEGDLRSSEASPTTRGPYGAVPVSPHMEEGGASLNRVLAAIQRVRREALAEDTAEAGKRPAPEETERRGDDELLRLEERLAALCAALRGRGAACPGPEASGGPPREAREECSDGGSSPRLVPEDED